ncbi:MULTISPECIES: ABC transporter permease [Rhizobium]|uniref:ABC transporter permease subunit n=1 Tax=Rhizobium leguminosarum TaxID=384 RepID=A0AAJ1EDL0_RHILE|nr:MULTISPECIES: ABC transporter permease subunit [Rhizobium]MBY3385914.1 ABC transporter permease subunit [Rhizobium laguerreae]MBY3399575.1 ABC transporter permease subunit [Rhizobium laguerreae]MBY3406513.1 ABC transporter permease subunit [Rhizobium laguerreae]MBY5534150.1 ABC transporter permease subunit [Rhizobium leguminosarum]MBY5580630.1 ABC transporter permease subunit [Rhizobium leguminosarum]
MASLELLGFGSTGWGALLIAAALMTLAVTATALAIGAVLGAIIAAAKLSGNLILITLGNVYTTVFRGVPELLIIYLIYFGGSSAVTAIGQAMGYEGFLGLPSFIAGALAVGIISGAYQAEVFRGAFLAISKGELEAASAIGMPRGMRLRRIIMPQVFRLAIPGLGNVWQLSLKDSALISVTGLAELMRTSQVAAGSTRHYFLFFIAGGCLYLLLTSLSDRIFNGAERRANRSMPASAMGQA